MICERALFRPLLVMASVLSAGMLGASEPYRPPTAPAPELKPLTPDQARKAVEMLKSPSSRIRQEARVALRKRSTKEELKTQALELTAEARKAHLAALEKLVQRGVPALDKVRTAEAAWTAQRMATMQKIRTNYDHKADKIAMLTEEHQKTELLLAELNKEMRGVEAAWKPLLDAVVPLEEMDRDVAILQREAASYQPKPAEKYLEELTSAKELLAAMKIFRQRSEADAELARAAAHNTGSRWASKLQVLFVELLNQKRHVVGLPPLRLDENLSKAATDHSQEMIALGYFAHESPVAANKSPGLRAKNAKFAGGWSGENIFKGSAAPDAAYGAWWGSDGHRFIMFAGDPNTAGVGPVAEVWTFMTGSRSWPADTRK